MSTSWSSPDPRRAVSGPAFGQPEQSPGPAGPPARTDALAALVTLVVPLLVAGPLGLAWAALAPHPQAVLASGKYLQADPASSDYIAGDGYFFAAVVLAGLVTGLVAHRLGRVHGPAVVPALAAGCLAAAYGTMRVGETVGLDAARQAAAAGAERLDVTVRLGALVALAGWPAAALLAYLVAALLLGRRPAQALPADTGPSGLGPTASTQQG